MRIIYEFEFFWRFLFFFEISIIVVDGTFPPRSAIDCFKQRRVQIFRIDKCIPSWIVTCIVKTIIFFWLNALKIKFISSLNNSIFRRSALIYISIFIQVFVLFIIFLDIFIYKYLFVTFNYNLSLFLIWFSHFWGTWIYCLLCIP